MTDDDVRGWIKHLVDDKVEEGPTLDYKELQGLDQPNQRREVARDVSSFANEIGGVVVYGIAEDRSSGRPIPVSPFGIAPIPNFADRVENVLVDSIRPALPEYRIRELRVSSKPYKVVYLVWTPESWVGVHMVEALNDHRYYHRGQYRAVEMTEREVRDRYERILRSRDWVEQFASSPEVNHVARWLHGYQSNYLVCPELAFQSSLDLNSSQIRAWLQSHLLSPSHYRPWMHGVRTTLITRGGNDWDTYTEIYRNGAISHWRPTDVSMPENALAHRAELEAIYEFLLYAATFYEMIKYTGPLRLIVTISHDQPAMMTGLRFPRPQGLSARWPNLFSPDSTLMLELDTSGASLMSERKQVLKNLADQMFRAFGFWEADCFNESLDLIWPGAFSCSIDTVNSPLEVPPPGGTTQ